MKPKRNALGQFASRRRRNPERPAPMELSLAEIRRHVAGEASTAKGHHALALVHYREAAKFNVRGDYAKADYHGQMAHEHERRAKVLGGKVANPGINDAEIRRRVASEATTMRGHRVMAIAHREEASRALQRRERWMADYYNRMADAHASMAHALAGVASARRR